MNDSVCETSRQDIQSCELFYLLLDGRLCGGMLSGAAAAAAYIGPVNCAAIHETVCVCVLACTYAQNLIHRRRVSCAEVGCCCMQGRSQKNTINIFQIFRRKYVFIFECI